MKRQTVFHLLSYELRYTPKNSIKRQIEDIISGGYYVTNVSVYKTEDDILEGIVIAEYETEN